MPTCLVFAHFHQSGLIRSDTSTLLNILIDQTDEIYFISTNVTDSELKKLDPRIVCKVRENHGYDFYSYKTGLELIDFKKDYSHLTLMNSSFLCANPQKFIHYYFKQGLSQEFNVIGMTKSWEETEHIQSYLISLSREVLKNNDFLKWWADMTPVNNRDDVILNYELGLSNLLRSFYRLQSVFKTVPHIGQEIQNPVYRYYVNLLEDAGILKIQILNNNRWNIDYSALQNAINQDDNFLALVKEGLDN
jgi:rhamnosyltransferase